MRFLNALLDWLVALFKRIRSTTSVRPLSPANRRRLYDEHDEFERWINQTYEELLTLAGSDTATALVRVTREPADEAAQIELAVERGDGMWLRRRESLDLDFIPDRLRSEMLTHGLDEICGVCTWETG